ncbi:hypothetical protein AN958_10997 [Leucoagaricus sp. SymC.cos]|nr:hypothetical protein AN958_10997 [Leucoagaricus sp. SymC.cos]
MYAIATADISYTVSLLFNTLFGKNFFQFWLLYPKYSMFVTNTFVAHSLLLYRCVVVWGHSWWLIGLGIFGLVSVTAVGYALEGTSLKLVSTGWVYLSLTLVLNLALTGLTAGRILYITKQNYHLLPEPLKRRYIITIAILIECGALYTIYLALILAFRKHANANTVLDCAAVQVVGVVPTLIIVQVGLGRSASYDYSKEEPVQFLATKQPCEDSGSPMTTFSKYSSS